MHNAGSRLAPLSKTPHVVPFEASQIRPTDLRSVVLEPIDHLRWITVLPRLQSQRHVGRVVEATVFVALLFGSAALLPFRPFRLDGSLALQVGLLPCGNRSISFGMSVLLRIRRKVEVVDGDRSISIEPARDFRVSYAVDFDHPSIRRQELDFGPLTPERFERDISAARTFGFLREVHALWDAGFARGGSLDNTVVLDDDKVVNPEGLRWSDEFVRHKVLDLCGDLALLGLSVHGHVRAERGGHAMHQKLVTAILDSPDAWTVGEVGRRRGADLTRWASFARS